VIRYLTSEVRAFNNLKNLPLIAAFFGIGLGMMLGASFGRFRRWLPVAALLLFSIIRFAAFLHLPVVDISWNYAIGASAPGVFWRVVSTLRFLSLTLFLLGLVVFLFVALGSLVGEQLESARPIRTYGVNLAGSLAGMVLFSALSFFNFGPTVWLLVGFALLVPFFVHQRAGLFVLAFTLAVVAIPESGTFWSPYYRIDFAPIVPAGASQPSAYSVVTNHIWHQWAADASPEFLRRYPDAIPNR